MLRRDVPEAPVGAGGSGESKSSPNSSMIAISTSASAVVDRCAAAMLAANEFALGDDQSVAPTRPVACRVHRRRLPTPAVVVLARRVSQQHRPAEPLGVRGATATAGCRRTGCGRLHQRVGAVASTTLAVARVQCDTGVVRRYRNGADSKPSHCRSLRPSAGEAVAHAHEPGASGFRTEGASAPKKGQGSVPLRRRPTLRPPVAVTPAAARGPQRCRMPSTAARSGRQTVLDARANAVRTRDVAWGSRRGRRAAATLGAVTLR
jgi:hypothetical protein